jgi:hypothetical protein
MQQIGTIQFLQIQRESLKVGESSNRRYDPAALLTVPRLKLTPGGVIGITAEGQEIIDVHHVAHPRSRNRDDNFISMGFSSHYVAMRERFGPQVTDGIAGENLFIRQTAIITPQNFGARVWIETQTGQCIDLADVIPIPPCEPFSRYAAGRDLTAPEMKATLQYLRNGTRGFYMRIMDDSTEFIIQAGDVVMIHHTNS